MHLSTVIIHHYGYADGVVARKDKISRNLSLLKEQLKLNPRDAFHQFNIAVEYMRLGDYTQALQHLQLSLAEAEPDTSFTHLLYKYEIRCRIMSGDPAGALDACNTGCALFPDYPDLHHIRGFSCCRPELMRRPEGLAASASHRHITARLPYRIRDGYLSDLCRTGTAVPGNRRN